MPDQLPTIETERLVLRPYTLADAPRVQQMCNDPEVAATTLALPHPYPDGAADQWISTHEERFREGKGLTLAITLRQSGLIVGTMSLDPISPTHRRGELGYMVAREHWNHGYCTEAARATINHAFEHLGINRVQAMHFPRNPASGHVMEKLGMTREGMLRQYVFGRNSPEDVIVYAILKSDTGPRSGQQ